MFTTPNTFQGHPKGKIEKKSHILRTPAEGKQSPLIVSCPHAGIYVPDDFHKTLAADPLTFIRRGDLYTDRLTENAPEHGASHIISKIAPAYLNVGRSTDSIHPDDIRGDHQGLQTNPNDKYVKNGKQQGLVALRTLYKNKAIYKDGQEPNATEIKNRIDQYYMPYHDELEALVHNALKRHEHALVFDIHSCPSVGTDSDPDSGQKRTDIVLSNADGKSCDNELIDLMKQLTEEHDLSVSINNPYSGGFITQKYGAHSAKAKDLKKHGLEIQSVQIEFSRSAFGMNEETLEITDEKAFKNMQTFADSLIQLLSGYTQRDKNSKPSPVYS